MFVAVHLPLLVHVLLQYSTCAQPEAVSCRVGFNILNIIYVSPARRKMLLAGEMLKIIVLNPGAPIPKSRVSDLTLLTFPCLKRFSGAIGFNIVSISPARSENAPHWRNVILAVEMLIMLDPGALFLKSPLQD